MATHDLSNSHPVGGGLVIYGTFSNGKLTLEYQHETEAPPKAHATLRGANLSAKWDFPDMEINAFNEILHAFFVVESHIAIASPTRWHVGNKRATCLRLKARDA